MFSNRTPGGRNNVAGVKVAQLRKNLRISRKGVKHYSRGAFEGVQ